MNLTNWLQSETAVWVVQSLAHFLWQGVVLLILGSAVERLLKRRSDKVRRCSIRD